MTSDDGDTLANRLRNGIVVLDGHDGAGKSTVVRLLRDELGGSVVKPFNDSLGDLLVWLVERERFDLANQLARQAVEKCIEESPAGPRWFDRHWLSLFTLLPERYHESWLPLPKTVLCWADPEVTMRRLVERGEPVGDPAHHRFYCRRYLELAERFGVPVVDTSETTGEEAAEAVMELLRR